MSDVAVVGGGIIGAACAYELAGRGMSVTLVERSELAAGTSGRNHGLVLVPPDPVLVPMFERSLAMYRTVAAEAPVPVRLDHDPIGFLVVAGDDEVERTGARAEAELVAASGVRVERVDGEMLRVLEPELGPDLVEGWLLDDGRRVDPAALTVSLALLARRRGAEVRTHETVRSLIVDGGTVRGVVGDQGAVEADTVVLAAGPWSAPLLRPLGIDLPVTGARGWLVHMRPERPPVERLVELGGWHALPQQNETRVVTAGALAEGYPVAEVGVLLQPNPDGTMLVGGSRQDALTGEPEDADVPSRLLRGAARIVPAMAQAQVLGSWWGVRPMTPDGRPLVGTLAEGLVVATGHGSQGVILAGGTAELVASLVTGSRPPFDVAPFDPVRSA